MNRVKEVEQRHQERTTTNRVEQAEKYKSFYYYDLAMKEVGKLADGEIK